MELQLRYQAILQRIKVVCQVYGKDPGSIKIVGASKFQPTESIRKLFALGIRSFGENYVQELTLKRQALTDLDIEWHYIGALQSHKLRLCFAQAHEIQTLASAKHADKLQVLAAHAQSECQVMIQVNPEGEDSKQGVSLEEFGSLRDHVVQQCPNLKLLGIMAIPQELDPQTWTKDVWMNGLPPPPIYQQLAQLSQTTPGKQLSLGMSDDLEFAVAAGSNCLRLGTALFGPRSIS